MKYESYALTDVGRKRPHNEDFMLSRPHIGLHIVCDGMGGHAAGEVASALAVQAAAEVIERNIEEIHAGMSGSREGRKSSLELVEAAVQEANARVYESSEANADQRGMGTTLTLLIVHRERALVAQVGDSRLYLVRAEQSHQVTTDHTILTDALRAGRVDPNDENAKRKLNALTRAVGVHPSVEVDTLELDTLPGDVLLLCSDGLCGYLDDFDLAAFFRHSTNASAARDLVEFALKRGGHDNITVITVHVRDAVETEQSLRVRLTLDTLKSIPLFHYLTFNELLRVIPVCQARFLMEGDQVIGEGESGADFFIVIEGRVRVHVGENEITEMGPGQYFGEMSLVDNRPRSASVTAVEPGYLIQISRRDFYEVLRGDSVMAVKLLWNFIQTLSGLVRNQNTTLVDESSLLAHPYDGTTEDGS
ncbi:MAG: serine/threonine protein phosphatase PrpC [Bradymonadia bacterium]|jgi:serine/threonine protein phosphatase PrpC